MIKIICKNAWKKKSYQRKGLLNIDERQGVINEGVLGEFKVVCAKRMIIVMNNKSTVNFGFP